MPTGIPARRDTMTKSGRLVGEIRDRLAPAFLRVLPNN